MTFIHMKQCRHFRLQAPRDRPVNMLLIPGRKGPVFLLFRQVVQKAGFLYDF